MFASRICFNGLLHRLDGTPKEIGVAHLGEVTGLHATAVCIVASYSQVGVDIKYDARRAVAAGQLTRIRGSTIADKALDVLSLQIRTLY